MKAKKNFVMISPVRVSLSIIFVLSVFIPFILSDEGNVRSRKRRYLTFPEESTLQLVYDQIIGVVDFTNLFILGITCAMAWQLPHEPYDEDFLKQQFLNDEEPKRRIDVNITDTPINDYLDTNHNSLDISSWNEILQKNFSYSESLWDDRNRKQFSYENVNPIPLTKKRWKKPVKKHLVYAAIGKRSVSPKSKLDRFYINHHRSTRHVIYKKIEKFLTARGVHGSDCLRKAICETNKKRNDEKPSSFVAEIMRVIFSLPAPNEDTTYSHSRERDYDVANSANVDCNEIYAKCNESLWFSDLI